MTVSRALVEATIGHARIVGYSGKEILDEESGVSIEDRFAYAVALLTGVAVGRSR